MKSNLSSKLNTISVDLTKIKILIVEDIENEQLELKDLLLSQFPVLKTEQIQMASDGYRGFEMAERYKPDLIFVDIRMPDLDGFGMLKMLELPNTYIIFTTWWDEYALTAFKFSPVAYLLKPIKPKELKAAMEKYQNSPIHAHYVEYIIQLVNGIRENGEIPFLTLVDHHRNLIKVDLNDIQYLQSDDTITYFYLKSGKRITSSKNIGKYSALTETHFVRTHQSYIVNLNEILHFKGEGKGGIVTLKSGVEIKVSRQRRPQVTMRMKEASFLNDKGKGLE